MNEGQLIRVHLPLKSGFVHQAAHGKVGQQKAVELLENQFGGLAAQNDLAAPQVGLQLVKSALNLPALMVESGQLDSWCCLLFQKIRHQPI